MKITSEQIRHIAQLAKLSLTDKEGELYSHQIARVIEYVNKLNTLETKNVQPTYHVVPFVNVLREDEIKKSPGTEILLKNAPEQENDSIKVPSVIS